MEISEKVAYIKGLAEGMELDASNKEGKILTAIIDCLDLIAEEINDIEEEIIDIEDDLDAVSDDLEYIEEDLYDDEDYDEDDEEDDGEYYVTTCPSCEEEVVFDDTVLEDGEIICPNCGEKLEFDLSDISED